MLFSGVRFPFIASSLQFSFAFCVGQLMVFCSRLWSSDSVCAALFALTLPGAHGWRAAALLWSQSLGDSKWRFRDWIHIQVQMNYTLYTYIYIYFHLNIISIIIKHPIMVEMKLFWTSVIQIKRTLEHPSNMQHALSWLHDCYDCYILHALMALDSRNHYMHVENLFEAEMLEPQLMALHLRDLGTPPDFWVWSLASQTW